MRCSTLFTCLCLIGSSAAASAQVFTSNDQVRQALVGNTISGEEKGKRYVEYFHPDGRISGFYPDEREGDEEAEGPYTGHWRIGKAQLCVRYAEDDGREGAWDCSPVEVKGWKVIWASDGERSVSSLTPGNPFHFLQ